MKPQLITFPVETNMTMELLLKEIVVTGNEGRRRGVMLPKIMICRFHQKALFFFFMTMEITLPGEEELLPCIKHKVLMQHKY